MTFMMRTSERGSFKRCPQKWWWGNEEGLTSLRSKPALWFGSAVHDALAKWYLPGFERGQHPTETILQELAGQRKMLVTNEDEEKKYVDATLLGEHMMNRYVKFYGEDPKWNVIATEQTFQVWIKHPTKPGRWLRYVGTADGVYIDEETGEVWLMEHKTAAAIKTTHLPLDDQAGSYWAVMNGKLRKMGVLKRGQSIAGIQYNFLRKALDDERPHNKDGLATNLPKKEHYVAALSAPGFKVPKSAIEVMGPIDLSADLSKHKLSTLEFIAHEARLTVYGDPSANQPPPYFERFGVYRSVNARKTMIERIQNEALHMEAIRNGTLPLFKTPTRDCDWGCDFFRLCQMHEEGSEFFEDYKEAEFTTRDPYEDHRNKKSADA